MAWYAKELCGVIGTFRNMDEEPMMPHSCIETDIIPWCIYAHLSFFVVTFDVPNEALLTAFGSENQAIVILCFVVSKFRDFITMRRFPRYNYIFR